VTGEAVRVLRAAADLFGFGLAQTLIQVANILAIHGDRFVVGRSMGAEQLGNYTRAYELIKLPAAIYTNVVGNVLFPAFSRLQHDKPRLAAGFRRATFANALILLPASAALIAIAPEAIRVVMGAQWDAALSDTSKSDTSNPDTADLEGGTITDEARKYWAFQRPAKRPLPPGANHPVDAFVLSGLRDHGLKPAPAADKVTLAMSADAPVHSLDAPVKEDVALGEFLPDVNILTPEGALLQQDVGRRTALALSLLSERERYVLEMRFGLRDSRVRTLQEVAERLGVTRERVRQIEKRAFERLRRAELEREKNGAAA
jgi:RNA polymerase sigma factor (sigma-70 family)